ncbi:antibiotic biosynthesis monooxygenase [Modestobacter sp. I12A-02628]|uniref:Antibiotic biosynthesis monooxygenase n=2 Tax=Goekera deserti TaxID=2497753 RepID=A0A7K3WIV3_9ACTN|nr:antibiotic biosynthesis monooxygenase [Goekera deserti]NDI47157.1 antibiotic biosynthesis monooxygenase [Goekera deserti]NEL55443.1 antibiotic biosynthesis monooxygenase [Goekera deserti]
MDFAPADRDAALAAFAEVVAESRREPGCVDYAFSPDALVPGRVRVFEHWSGEAALAAHLALPHVARLRASIAGLTRTGRQLARHTVVASAPMGGAAAPRSTEESPA